MRRLWHRLFGHGKTIGMDYNGWTCECGKYSVFKDGHRGLD